MALPIKYTPLPSPAVATINYIDLAEGVTILNGFTSETTGTINYSLSTSSPYSYKTSLSGTLGTGIIMSGSFLSNALNRPMILQGTALVTFGWRVTNSSSSNNNFPVAWLQKYDGSTTTDIAFVSGSILNSANGITYTTTLLISDIPSTLIKSGEQIVLKMGINGVDAGNSPRGIIGCDPQNRDGFGVGAGNYDTSKLILAIPTKIQ